MKTNNHECKFHPANYVIQAGNHRSLRAREGRWGVVGSMIRTARNENEAQPMSPGKINHPRSGVGEHGMSGRLREISGAISSGRPRPDVRSSSNLAVKAGAARGEVGSVYRSNEGGDVAGAKGPNLNSVNSEAQDPCDGSLEGDSNDKKVRALQRTLCRHINRAVTGLRESSL